MAVQLRRVKVCVAAAAAPLLVLACSAFGEDNPVDTASSPEAGSTAEGATTADAATDSMRDGSEAATDAYFLQDGAIKPFGSACMMGDPPEVEGNDTDVAANVMTGVVCGFIDPAGDKDVFRYEATTSAIVRVGFHISGNGKIEYTGPGVSGGPGASSPSYYRSFDVGIKGPGTIYFTVSASTRQEYRLVVAQ